MHIENLTRDYAAVYSDFTTWQALLEQLLADPIEALTIENLSEELRRKGRFRSPVTLGLYEDWETGEREEDDVLRASYQAVTDGTHRVLAHLHTGITEVLTQSEEEWAAQESEDDPAYWLIASTEIELPVADLEAAFPERLQQDDRVPEDGDLELWEILVSLRIDDEVWLTSPTSGSQRDSERLRYSITWDRAALELDPAILHERLLAKLQQFGYDTSYLQLRTLVEDYSGDEPVTVRDSGATLVP